MRHLILDPSRHNVSHCRAINITGHTGWVVRIATLVNILQGVKTAIGQGCRVLISFIVPLGLFFWDYGNAFLLEARRAGADVDEQRKENGSRSSGAKENGGGAEMEKASSSIAFRYPSYVQDIMG